MFGKHLSTIGYLALLRDFFFFLFFFTPRHRDRREALSANSAYCARFSQSIQAEKPVTLEHCCGFFFQLNKLKDLEGEMKTFAILQRMSWELPNERKLSSRPPLKYHVSRTWSLRETQFRATGPAEPDANAWKVRMSPVISAYTRTMMYFLTERMISVHFESLIKQPAIPFRAKDATRGAETR